METSAASVCVQASLLAQECWHQVCSPDRQLHCSGVFNMPDQDPSVLKALKKIKKCINNERKIILARFAMVQGEKQRHNQLSSSFQRDP